MTEIELQPNILICRARCISAIVVGLYMAGNALTMSWNQLLVYQDQKRLRELNELVVVYSDRSGKMPDCHLIDLYRTGLTKRRIHPTPFGGFYRLNSTSGVVYNPSHLLVGHPVSRSSSHLSQVSLQNR